VHIKSIDFLKGMAILGVLTMHSCVSHACLNYGTPVEILLLQSVPIFLILMGIVGAISLNEKGLNLKPYITKKATRFILPLIPVFFITLYIGLAGYKPIVKSPMMLLGQMPVVGPGNYYITLVLASIVTIPLLWYISKKSMGLMLAGSFGISILFELIFPNGYSAFLYIFKFQFAFAIGIYLADCIFKKKIPLLLDLGIFLSTSLVVYLGITGTQLFNYELTYFNALTFLFAAGLILSIIFLNISWAPIDFLGNASYHIFLTQMIFFILFNFGYIINLFVTISVGILFYWSDNKLQMNINRNGWLKN